LEEVFNEEKLYEYGIDDGFIKEFKFSNCEEYIGMFNKVMNRYSN
jgi:hypothetical protein